MGRHLTAVLLALVVFGAGCVGSPHSPEATESPGAVVLDFEGEGGRIRGLVVDTELTPIAGALVAVHDLFSVTTGNNGTFDVAQVPPGDHRVLVQALGFQSVARSLNVVAGGVTEARFELEPIPIVEPWSETVITQGMVCLQWWLVFRFTLSTVCALDEGGSSFYNFEVRWDLSTLVSEMAWEPSSGLTARAFYYAIWQGGTRTGVLNCEYCYGNVLGPSPLYLRSDPPFEGLVEQSGPHTLTNTIFTDRDPGNPTGVNIVYQQRITMYNTMFYGTTAPPGASALPDS